MLSLLPTGFKDILPELKEILDEELGKIYSRSLYVDICVVVYMYMYIYLFVGSL